VFKFNLPFQAINGSQAIWITLSIRQVFYISDGTAITAEVLGHAVMSQSVTINSITLPFIESESRAGGERPD
jgi:hypothetical protein